MAHHRSTRRENLPLHPVRHRILDVLQRMPGANISDLCKEASMTWGSAQHHLYIMERSGLVEGVAQGRSHGFFLPAPKRNESLQKLLILRRTRVLEFAQAVLAEPGITQQVLAERLVMTRKVIRRCVDLLKAEDFLVEERRAKYKVYRPGDALLQLLVDPQVRAMFDEDASTVEPKLSN